MSSGQMRAKARFGLLCAAETTDFMLVEHMTKDGPTYSLQILQRTPDGKQQAIPIGTIFSEGDE